MGLHNMKEPTTAELYRLLQDHLSREEEYQSRFEEKLDAILIQTTKHNGRMTSMEHWRERFADPLLDDYKDKRSQGSGMIKMWALFGGGLLLIIGLTATLYVKDLRTQIIKELDECCIIQTRS